MKNVILILGFYLFSCSSCGPKESPPDYVLSDEQLSNLMLDIQLADVVLGEVNGLKRDSLKDVLWLRMVDIYDHPVYELEKEVRKLESDQEKLSSIMDRVQVLLDSLR